MTRGVTRAAAAVCGSAKIAFMKLTISNGYDIVASIEFFHTRVGEAVPTIGLSSPHCGCFKPKQRENSEAGGCSVVRRTVGSPGFLRSTRSQWLIVCRKNSKNSERRDAV